MSLSLFEFELPENLEPEDNTRLTLVNLYFSQEEKARFNELIKIGMVKEYGNQAKDHNAIDFMLMMLERHYGNQQPEIWNQSGE